MRAAVLIAGCFVLFAAVSVRCANIPADEVTVVHESDEVEHVHGDELRGRFTTPGEQCQDRNPQGMGGVCKTDDPAKRCTQLKCADLLLRHDAPIGSETGPALDGTWCGDNKICYRGSCIEDTEPPKNTREIFDYQYDCEDLW